MSKRLHIILIIGGIALFTLMYFLQNVVVSAISIIAFIIAIYYGEKTKSQSTSITQGISNVQRTIGQLDNSVKELKSEFNGHPLTLLNKYESGTINLVETERLKTEVEKKQKEISDRDKVIAAGVVIGGLALLAYFLSKKD